MLLWKKGSLTSVNSVNKFIKNPYSAIVKG